MTEPYDCENCEHYVRITDGRTAKDRICIFDGECEHLPMTNEEWLRSLNTEQLAEWLVDVTQYCFECGLNTNNCVLCPFGKCIDKGFAMEWLKQPHHEKE